MGRPNKPTELKKIEGNRSKRRLNRQEPDPEYLDDMTPPAWLPAAAKAVWTEYAPKLRKAKVLTVLDVPAFEKWCVKHAQWRAAVLDLARLGVMVDRVGKDGDRVITKDEKAKSSPHQVVNQLVFAESMFFKQTVTLEREFGMTPAARTRVQVDPQLTLFHDDAGVTAKPEQAQKGSAYFTGGEARH